MQSSLLCVHQRMFQVKTLPEPGSKDLQKKFVYRLALILSYSAQPIWSQLGFTDGHINTTPSLISSTKPCQKGSIWGISRELETPHEAGYRLPCGCRAPPHPVDEAQEKAIVHEGSAAILRLGAFRMMSCNHGSLSSCGASSFRGSAPLARLPVVQQVGQCPSLV